MPNPAQKIIGETFELALDLKKIRRDFPILKQSVHGQSIVYLDNAATTQKPKSVIQAISRYYEEYNSNIHRGVHLLSEKATEAYEDVRGKVAHFLGAHERSEIIFVRGATEGINLVAESYGRAFLKPGHAVVVSTLEHHSNIVPWQRICEATGAELIVIPISDQGEITVEDYAPILSRENVRVLSVGHISNALGTINPVREMIDHLRQNNSDAVVLIDGAQAVPHKAVNVQDIDCDFYVFSGHKMYGPTGIGVLYGRKKILETMPPYQSGGDMIRTVSFSQTTYNDLPYRFEAGTPDIAGVIGLGAAIDYLQELGFDRIERYETELISYAEEKLSRVEGLTIIGHPLQRAGVISFVLQDVHPHDIGTILDRSGIAIRTGHHCAMPLMQRFNLSATARMSVAFYNTKKEIDALVKGLEKVKEVFRS